MQCRMVRSLMPLYIQDALRPTVKEQVSQHLADCPACRLLLAELQASRAQAAAAEPAAKPTLPTPLAAYQAGAKILTPPSEPAVEPVLSAPLRPEPPVPSPDRPLSQPRLKRADVQAERSTGSPRAVQPKAEATRVPAVSSSSRQAVPTPSRTKSAVVAQTVITALVMIMALVFGLAWNGANLRLQAQEKLTTQRTYDELVADFGHLQAPLLPGAKTSLDAIPVLNKDGLALSLLQSAAPLHREDYLPVVDAYNQTRQAVVKYAGEQQQGSSPAATTFAKDAAQAINEVVQKLRDAQVSWPATPGQHVEVRKAAERLNTVSTAYLKATATAAPSSAANDGALPTSSPTPNKPSAAPDSQLEQAAVEALAQHEVADQFIMLGHQEKDGVVTFTAQRLVEGLRYFEDLAQITVARADHKVVSFQRPHPAAAWSETPVYQVSHDAARAKAAAGVQGQQADPDSEGALGVAHNPAGEERLVWAFAPANSGTLICVDAQTGETWMIKP